MEWLETAQEVTEYVTENFSDEGVSISAIRKPVKAMLSYVKRKSMTAPLPSGNAVMASNLIYLNRL